MRWSYFTILLSSILLLEFCSPYSSNNNDTLGAIKVELELELKVDSTAYYDSLFAPLQHSLDTFFNKKFKYGQFNGNVLFAKKGRIIINKSYGFTDLKNKDTLTLEHTFQLASASKPFTAIAILQLYEKGLINLDDSINKFFPEFPYHGIDIHQLLCHRSGLSQYTHFCDAPDSIWPNKNKTIFNDDVLQIISDIVPLINYPPDKKYYYCNTNYLLLASIIEKVSGMKFEDYLYQNIFQPLGMNRTKVFKRDNFNELIQPARGHVSSKLYADNTYLNGCVGDKGIYSNVKELFVFDRALKDNSLISEETYQLAIKEHNEMFKVNQNYGYGFRLLHTSSKGKIVFHTGWWKGFRSYFIRIIESDETIIILDNVKRGPFFNIENLANLLPSNIKVN
jgi:CubicO group peptidase (beta-lactamase class C family)